MTGSRDRRRTAVETRGISTNGGNTLMTNAARIGVVLLGATLLPSCAPMSTGRGFMPGPHPVATRSLPPGCGTMSCRFPDIHIYPEVTIVLTSPPLITVRPRVIVNRNPRRWDVRLPAPDVPRTTEKATQMVGAAPADQYVSAR